MLLSTPEGLGSYEYDPDTIDLDSWLRPHGFSLFTEHNQLHSIYLIAGPDQWPVKVGIAKDPVPRYQEIQNSNWLELSLFRYWWQAGKPLTLRAENIFKDRFAEKRIRGEWFDVPPDEAEAAVKDAIEEVGAWHLTEREMRVVFKRALRKAQKKFDQELFGEV